MSCCGNSNHGCAFDPDREGPSENDVRIFGGDGITCPECGADVYHDAAMCNTCGHAMTDDHASGSRKWVAVTSVIVLAAFILVFAL